MRTEIRFPAMGSEAYVIVQGDRRLAQMARARIEDLERKWSRFIPDSEINRLNGRRGVPHRVSEETFRLVERALDGWRYTGGRFDPMARSGVRALRSNAGGIRLDVHAMTVELPVDAGFDPGGIGKAMAADLAVQELMDAGAEGACVNLGGDLRVEGWGPDRGRWVVSQENPRSGASLGLVALAAGGIATATRAIAVTVVARDAASAQIATKHALLAAAGWELRALEELGCDGLIVDVDGELRWTEGFGRFRIGELTAVAS